MSILTRPQGRIPIGYATVQGQRVPVIIDLEWERYFSILTERAGGITGVSTTELVESAYEDAGINEINAQSMAFEQGQNQRPPMAFEQGQVFDNGAELRARVDALALMVPALENNAELRARIDALETEIQALKQGATA
jgi:hypothetical protein